MSGPSINCVYRTPAALGESPVWDPKIARLYWVDSMGRQLNRLDPVSGDNRAFQLPSEIGSIALLKNGGLLVALKSSICAFDPETELLVSLANVVGAPDENRLNDGRMGPDGAFWVGGMSGASRAPSANIYRFATDSSFVPKFEGLILSNSICWSPDGRLMYFSDSWKRIVWVCDFDAETGQTGERRVFAEQTDGMPDGAVTDVEGNLWLAVWGGGAIHQYSPQGKLLQRIPMPVSRPTCPAFGGADMSHVFVTSATLGMTLAERHAEPLAGSVLSFESSAFGFPERRFEKR